jgi:hypothetical protein
MKMKTYRVIRESFAITREGIDFEHILWTGDNCQDYFGSTGRFPGLDSIVSIYFEKMDNGQWIKIEDPRAF